MACGQCELQGVGRQVWLCLTGVGSQRNLAQRGPGGLGERDLPVCRRSSQPLRGGAWRTAGPRTRLSPRRYMSPASQAPSFCHSPRSLARQGREKRARAWGGGRCLRVGCGSCPGTHTHRKVGRATAPRRQMRERPHADACARQRRAHPQTASCACGGPAELTGTGGVCPEALAPPGPLLGRVSPYVVATGFSSHPRGWLRGHLVISSPAKKKCETFNPSFPQLW